MLDRLKGMRPRLLAGKALRNPFGRNVAILSVGTAFAQAIPLLISPILTRIFTPEDFGVLALYTATVGILAVAASGRYEMAIMLPERQEDADNLVILSILLAMLFSLSCLGIVLVFGDQLAAMAGGGESRAWLYAAPAGIFLTATYLALNFWLNRSRRYWVMSRNRVMQSTSGGVLSILLGLGGVRPVGLILGLILGQLVTTATIAASFLKRRTLYDSFRENRDRCIELARRYRHHPMHLLPSQILTAASVQLPLLAISAVYGVAAAGFFLLAMRSVAIPVSVVATAIGDVYRQEIAVRYRDHGQFRRIFLNVTVSNAILGIVPFSLLFLFAESIFAFVFGSGWEMSGRIAQLLAISAYFQFVFTPVDKGAVVAGATRYILFWCITRFTLTVALCVAAIYLEFDMLVFVAFLIAINIAMYVFDGYVEYVISLGGARNTMIPVRRSRTGNGGK
jgi:O-antigen/teichoic acid export membrane protein